MERCMILLSILTAFMSILKEECENKKHKKITFLQDINF